MPVVNARMDGAIPHPRHEASERGSVLLVAVLSVRHLLCRGGAVKGLSSMHQNRRPSLARQSVPTFARRNGNFDAIKADLKGLPPNGVYYRRRSAEIRTERQRQFSSS